MIARYTRPEMAAIWSEDNKFQKYLEVEVASLEAWAKLKKVPVAAVDRIRKNAKFNVKSIERIEKETNHDLISFIKDVSSHLGKDARFFHLGLTSSDVVDTAWGSLIKDAVTIIEKDLKNLLKVLGKKAKQYKKYPCIGRTHGIHAEPSMFGLKFALYYAEMKRNIARLEDAKKFVCVGKISGAVGNYANIPPKVEEYVCKRLGIGVEEVSTQVVQRDRHAHFLNTLAIIGASLEKIALEIRHLQKTELREAEEPFRKGQKGSSAMPHKRNPIMCERVCGLARILRSNALAGMENIALWHERDISHSSVERVIIPDSTILVNYLTNVMIRVVSDMHVYSKNMKKDLDFTRGLVFSQRVLLKLIDNGADRLTTYNVVQKNAMEVWQAGKDFMTLLKDDSYVRKYLNEKEIEDCFDVSYYGRNVDKIYKRIGLK